MKPSTCQADAPPTGLRPLPCLDTNLPQWKEHYLEHIWVVSYAELGVLRQSELNGLWLTCFCTGYRSLVLESFCCTHLDSTISHAKWLSNALLLCYTACYSKRQKCFGKVPSKRAFLHILGTADMILPSHTCIQADRLNLIISSWDKTRKSTLTPFHFLLELVCSQKHQLLEYKPEADWL